MSGVAGDGLSVAAFGNSPSWLTAEAASAPPNNLTLELWVFMRADAAGASRCAIAWDGAVANTSFVNVRTGGDFQFTSNGVDVVSPATYTRQAWRHVVGTNASGALKLYIDGAQVQTGSAGTHTITAVAVSVLAASAGAIPFRGWVAEPAVYATALPAARVLAHYNAADTRGVPPYPTLGAPPTGGSPLLSVLLADLGEVLASVRHTFPAT